MIQRVRFLHVRTAHTVHARRPWRNAVPFHTAGNPHSRSQTTLPQSVQTQRWKRRPFNCFQHAAEHQRHQQPDQQHQTHDHSELVLHDHRGHFDRHEFRNVFIPPNVTEAATPSGQRMTRVERIRARTKQTALRTPPTWQECTFFGLAYETWLISEFDYSVAGVGYDPHSGIPNEVNLDKAYWSQPQYMWVRPAFFERGWRPLQTSVDVDPNIYPGGIWKRPHLPYESMCAAQKFTENWKRTCLTFGR